MKFLIIYKKTPVDIVNFYKEVIVKPSEEDVVDLVEKHSGGNYLADAIAFKKVD